MLLGMIYVASKTAKDSKKSAKAKAPAKKRVAAKAATSKKTESKSKPAPKAAAKSSAKPAAKPAAKATAAKATVAKAPAKTTTPAAKATKIDPKTAAKLKAAAEIAAAKKPVAPVPQKIVGKIPPKKPGESEAPGDADSPLLDMSDVGVRKMIARAKARGYVTYDELNKVLPSEKTSSEQIEDTMSMLNEMGINVIESEEQEEGADGDNLPATAEGGKEVATTTGKAAEQYDRTDDPVRMYLREMGSVELLSREGEIAIAKRIEAGRELMIGALCESPLTFEALTVWRDELN